MGLLAKYDPKLIIVTFGAPITGFADGTYLTVEMNEDLFTLAVGAGGDSCRAKSNNLSGKFKFILMQSSISNDYLSAIHAADIITNDGILPILIKDLNGTSFYAAEKAWIMKFPQSEFGKEVTNREWVLETDHLVPFVGSEFPA